MLKRILRRISGNGVAELEQRAAQFHRKMHQEMDQAVPEGATVFLGDSHTLALVLSNVADGGAVKFATGGQHSSMLLAEMRELSCLARASRVVICIGTNDVIEGADEGIEDRYRQILAAVPAGVPVVLSSIPPLQAPERRERARKTVESARRAAASDPRCTFVDAFTALSTPDGAPLPGVLWEDGIHLTAHGYGIWVQKLRDALP